MPVIPVPYYKSHILCEVDDSRFLGIVSKKELPEQTLDQQAKTVEKALCSPIGSERLCELVQGKKRILLITSDHTRPMPSRVTIPILLKEIRKGAPDAEIHILVATGFHRKTTEAELRERFGNDVYEAETILVHDANKINHMAYFGIMPSAAVSSGSITRRNGPISSCPRASLNRISSRAFPVGERAYCPVLPR